MYKLQKYSGRESRYACPKCKSKFSFTRYVDISNNFIHPKVGRCNREIKCGYHFPPKEHFANNEEIIFSNVFKSNPKPKSIEKQKISFIPSVLFEKSILHPESNNFIIYLLDNFHKNDVEKAIENYAIGTIHKPWKGACIFWQIDSSWSIRTGKIMSYSTEGKRIKHPYNHISWIHTHYKIPSYNLTQCLFGEHLLLESNKKIAICESEKTAIIASIIYPKFTWLATGGLSNLKLPDLNKLKHKKVLLFPDSGGLEKWKNKVNSFSLSNIIVSDLLENQTKEGTDLADIILQ